MLESIYSSMPSKFQEAYKSDLARLPRLAVDWNLWAHIPKAKLRYLVALSCDVNPEESHIYDNELAGWRQKKGWMDYVSYELSRRERIVFASIGEFDFEDCFLALPLRDRSFSTAKFRVWAELKGFDLPENFPKGSASNLITAQNQHKNTIYPWGTHNTHLLSKLSEAAEKFWALYDPTDPSTAPTNEQVSDWLTSEGVSQTLAESIATILRADGLKTGRRKL